ncbi:MAG TPA: hypothetical protein VGG29_13115 [Caulobacteraceae bacterium]|jgi:hypothetical protein
MARPRGRAAAAWLAAAALVAPAGAGAATPVDPDLLTVSGRAALPSGEGTPLAASLQVGAVTLDPGVAAAAHEPADALQAAFAAAAAKSLKNYGYRWIEGGAPAGAGPSTLAIEIEPFDITPDDKGDRVVARLKVAASAASGCFPYEATGDFHALTPLHSGGNQKALAIMLVIASAAAGYAAPGLLADQFNNADQQQAAMNAKRIVGKAEGVAPQGGPDVVVRYGAINALQLALASLVGHLGEPGGCNAPAATLSAAATPAAATTTTAALAPASQTTAAPPSAAAALPPPAAATPTVSHP